MRWGLLFFGFLFMGIAFELVEGWADKKWGQVDLFAMIDAKMNPSSYVYYTNETLERIFLALLIRHLMSMVDRLIDFREYVTAFIILEGIDLVDFWITGNTLWFEYYGEPVTYNIIKIFIFVIFLSYEYASHLRTS